MGKDGIVKEEKGKIAKNVEMCLMVKRINKMAI